MKKPDMADTTAQIFEVVRGTTHDGPGIRTTVFLKGCPLSCTWCQNPEGISTKPEIGWEKRKCINCHRCIDACKRGALSDNCQVILCDRALCNLCGDCVEVCPSRAMDFTSKEWTREELVKEALKDKEYYEAFGGGVTVSGGDPLLQYGFVKEFFKELKKNGIHTALDTCGLVPMEAINSVLPYTDLVLYDLKFIDDSLHKKYTGSSNKLILKNLMKLAEEIRNVNTCNKTGENKLWIRTPLIPGTTGTIENLDAISSFIHENIEDVVERWELCTFNRACISKYDKLGLDWEFKDTGTMKQKTVDELKESALSSGFDDKKLVTSGMVAK